jgi:AbrB family looped-hinge helix DNA binding protein
VTNLDTKISLLSGFQGRVLIHHQKSKGLSVFIPQNPPESGGGYEMIKTLKSHKGSYRLTIPKDIVRHLGWKEGDKILFRINGKNLILEKLEDSKGFKPALELLETQEETKPIIYTVGYEGKTISNLIDILQKHGIRLLVDVRELPLSRKNGFSKTALKEHLNKAGIEYISIRELGTPKEIRHDLRDKAISWQKFRELYIEYLNKHMDAVKRLEELAKSKPTVIMCYEKDWRICHRSIIAEYLEKDGFEVIHL